MYACTKKSKDAPHPSVRSACEPCRARKMRCIIPAEGGSCNDCRSRKISCYFLPRYKSGRRPLKNDNAEARAGSYAGSKASEECASTDEHLENPTQLNPSEKRGSVPVGYGNNSNEPNTDNGRDLNLVIPPGGGPPALSEYNLTPEFEAQEPNFAGSIHGSASHEFNNMHTAARDGFFTPVLDGMGHTTFDAFPSPINLEDYYHREDTRGRLATILEHFCKLRVHLPSKPTPLDQTRPVSTGQKQHILADINNSCIFLFSLYDSGSHGSLDTHTWNDDDFALASLVNALVVVIIRIADNLLLFNVFRKTEMADVLALKRLDYNVTQAKVVAMQVQQATLDGTLLSQSIRQSTGSVEAKLKSLG